MVKLVARLLAAVALWVRIQTFLKNVFNYLLDLTAVLHLRILLYDRDNTVYTMVSPMGKKRSDLIHFTIEKKENRANKSGSSEGIH
jgi:hypothetical protein